MLYISILLLILAVLPMYLVKDDSAIAVPCLFPAMLFFFLAGAAEHLGNCSVLSWNTALMIAAVLAVIGGICLLIGVLVFEIIWNSLQKDAKSSAAGEDGK